MAMFRTGLPPYWCNTFKKITGNFGGNDGVTVMEVWNEENEGFRPAGRHDEMLKQIRYIGRLVTSHPPYNQRLTNPKPFQPSLTLHHLSCHTTSVPGSPLRATPC